MGAEAIDYRVSKIVVLCKDCGNDVGLYPARHKCTPVDRPPMPMLPVQFLNEKKNDIPVTSPKSNESTKWSLPKLGGNNNNNTKTAPPTEDEGVYFNNIATNLPEANEASGKKLWGKVRQNDKWKQLSEKNEKPKQSGKLWGKLLQATQNMAEKIPSRDDRGAESDEDDWEGETHVARVLREYYEKRNLALPKWLFDENMAADVSRGKNDNNLDIPNVNEGPVRSPSRRRLWDQNPSDSKKLSNREKERQELRQAGQQHTSSENYRRDDDDRNDRHRYNDDKYDRYEDDHRKYNSTDHYSNRGGRYNDNDNHSSRYNDNSYGRDDNHNTRYNEKSYDRDDDRSRRYNEKSYSRDDDRYNQDRHYQNKSNDHYRNYDDYSKNDRYERDPPRKNGYFDEDRYDRDSPRKNGYYEEDRYSPSHSRRRSPPRQQQRSNKYYDDSNDYSSPKSVRSARGYDDSSYSRSNRSGGNDLDDYYYDNSSRQIPSPSKDRYNDSSRRDPYLHSNNRRYVDDSYY